MLPIIVVSSKDDEAAKVTPLNLGGNDTVTRPYGIEGLLLTLQSIHTCIRALRQKIERAAEYILTKNNPKYRLKVVE